MEILGTGEWVDIDTATPEALRAAAEKYRRAAVETAERHAWTDRYKPTPQEERRPNLRDLTGGYRRVDDPMPVVDERDVARARALAEIQIALEAHEAEQATAAEAAKAEAAQAFQQTALGQLYRR